MTREKRLPSRDRKRLIDSIREERSQWRTYAPYLDEFRSQLTQEDDAACVGLSDVPDDVVLVESRFTLKDLRSEETATYTLAYPKDAAPEHGRISVFSPMGMAVVGARAGEVIRWLDESGPQTATVQRVLQRSERTA